MFFRWRVAINCHHLPSINCCVINAPMPNPQLSIRSVRAKELAHRLAKAERRSVAQVVECALERYQQRVHPDEPASEFYARLSRDYGVDIDLDSIIREDREPHSGIDL
jgi:hypothetical protein